MFNGAHQILSTEVLAVLWILTCELGICSQWPVKTPREVLGLPRPAGQIPLSFAEEQHCQPCTVNGEGEASLLTLWYP